MKDVELGVRKFLRHELHAGSDLARETRGGHKPLLFRHVEEPGFEPRCGPCARLDTDRPVAGGIRILLGLRFEIGVYREPGFRERREHRVEARVLTVHNISRHGNELRRAAERAQLRTHFKRLESFRLENTRAAFLEYPNFRFIPRDTTPARRTGGTPPQHRSRVHMSFIHGGIPRRH